MSTTATVPMIGPDGSSADIPVSRVNDALAGGGKLAVAMTAPDGSLAYIPHENVMAAIKAGGKMGQPSAQEGYKAPAPPQQPSAPSPGQQLGDTIGQVAGAVGDQLKETGKTVYNMVRHPIDTSPLGIGYQGAKFEAEHIDNPATPTERLQQLGVDIPGAKKAYDEGNIPSAIQKVVNPVAQALILKKAGEVVGSVADAAPKAVENLRPAGPQAAVMPRIGNMPLKTVNAAEGIFQAAAPTGTNVKFRASVYTALPDLAEVARKVNLDEAKGGIINPDMRVRATVDAIDAHLADMYKTELKPQIDAHAGETVQPNLSYDAKAGLRFLSKSSGQVGDRFLAAKALNGQPMTVAELDRLRLVTNEELTPLRNMTPQDRAMAQVTNKKMAGLQALDGNVGDSLNDYLQSKGEPGIKGYEQRYAALSDVRNGLRPRINATELDIDAGKALRPLVGIFRGKQGIASASQAAVADVNIGRKLQQSMGVLAESDLKPQRAIRQGGPPNPSSPIGGGQTPSPKPQAPAAKISDVTPQVKAADSMKYRNEVTDAYKGQVNGHIVATDQTGKPAGMLEYSLFDGKAHVDNIIVRPDMRRQGIGTRLFDELKKENPDHEIQHGMTTPEGTALVKAYKARSEGEPSTPADTSYRDKHKAPNASYGSPLHDLSRGAFPDDVYSPNAVRYYGTNDGTPALIRRDQFSFDLAKRVRNKPDAPVTIYRAVPESMSGQGINSGDWVTISRDYAKAHGNERFDGKFKILSKKVSAKDIFTSGDIHEWGYDPQN